MILINTFQEDPQGNQLVAVLHEMGFNDYLRVDMGRAFERNELRLQFDHGRWDWQLRFREAPDLAIGSDNLRTVFFRRSLHPSLHRRIFYPGPGDMDISQAFSALNWLLHTFDAGLFPFGHPAKISAGENKFQQLAAAAAAGLTTLPTLFATNPALLAEFAKVHGSVVVKTLGSQSTFEEHPEGGDRMNIFGAAEIDAATLAGHLVNYAHTQLFLQKAVPKVAEHRIIAMPGGFIDCRIDTSRLPAGEVDYRPHIGQIPHEIVALPDGLAARLQDYLISMDLCAGCFDFAELADGSLVFFECNPAGEWLWIERITGCPITRRMAECLVRHHERQA